MKKDYVGLKRRPFLMPIWLAAIGAAGILVVVGLFAWAWSTADSTTVIVIRNAETGVRAERLAQMFGDDRAPGAIDAIYVQPTQRGRATAAPLATRLGLSAAAVGADDPRALAQRVLADHAGGRILIVAGRHDVPLIAAALAETAQVPPVDEADFGTMFIVGVPRIGRPNILRAHY